MSLYLEIPYSDKDEVKSLGARWDFNKKSLDCINNIF